MSTEVIRQLVLDTLYGRRIGGTERNSCLVVNMAGHELAGIGAQAILPIEGVLREVDQGIRTGTYRPDHFLGLSYVVGAYLVNAARDAPARATLFIDSLSLELVREFISYTPVFFRRLESGYNFGVAPPDEFLRFIETRCHSEDAMIAEAAQRAYDRLTKRR